MINQVVDLTPAEKKALKNTWEKHFGATAGFATLASPPQFPERSEELETLCGSKAVNAFRVIAPCQAFYLKNWKSNKAQKGFLVPSSLLDGDLNSEFMVLDATFRWMFMSYFQDEWLDKPPLLVQSRNFTEMEMPWNTLSQKAEQQDRR